MNEVRLIDAEALKAEFKKMENYHSLKLPYDDVIDNAPTVDIPNYGGQVMPDTLQGWRYEERPQGECKDCKNYHSYYEQFTNKPRGDGYCVIAKMSSEGMTYINCTDSWSCADFCPKATAKNNG